MAGSKLHDEDSGKSRGDPVVFGKFELLDRIAVGGMAEIFLARSSSLGGLTRTCVIKRILPEYSCDRQFVSMFIDEARITIGLDHGNIVRLFDFGQVGGTYYMAMEYVDGLDLVDVLRLHKQTGTVMDPLAAAYVAQCMCEGLHHAHTQNDYRGVALGIVHRDVSPHNTFLSWRGDVKVGDFGIASAKNKLSVTQAGTLKGKFAYMSPEQTTGGLVDARADIWATGVVLHEALVGGRLFASDNPVATIGKVCKQPIPLPSERSEGVGTELDQIVMRALERNLGDRYQTAAEMARDLETFLGKAGYTKRDFAGFLSGLEWSETTSPARPRNPAAEPAFVDGAMPSVVRRVPAFDSDPEIRELIEQLRKQPDLWTLVDIGERHRKKGNEGPALSALRTAAALFAHRGLMVQAICAFAAAKSLLGEAQFRKELVDLAGLRGHDKSVLRAHLDEVDKDGFWDLMLAVDKRGVEAEDTFALHPAPLFGQVSPDDFARLVEALQVQEVKIGTVLVREGESGSSLYAIGRGKLVVYCKPGSDDDYGQPMDSEREVLSRTLHDEDAAGDVDRVYLSALADGDFFGEFSFLTGRPRSATVEAITDCFIVMLGQDAADRILHGDEAFKEPLLEFYKERVGELMMAKNPVFSLLNQEDRRELLMRSVLRHYDDQDIVVSQGETSEEMYFIKHGEVEVYREDDGMPVFINKLREGEFFGEMAAVHGTPRSASVRAMGDVELFCMSNQDLTAILAKEPRIKRLFEAAIQWRAAETSTRMAESRRIFDGI